MSSLWWTMASYRIRMCFRLIKLFFLYETERVAVEDSLSSAWNFSSEIPQGAVLSLMQFYLYVKLLREISCSLEFAFISIWMTSSSVFLYPNHLVMEKKSLVSSLRGSKNLNPSATRQQKGKASASMPRWWPSRVSTMWERMLEKMDH